MLIEQEYCVICGRATFVTDGEFGCRLPAGGHGFVCHDCIDGVPPPKDGAPQRNDTEEYHANARD